MASVKGKTKEGEEYLIKLISSRLMLDDADLPYLAIVPCC